MEIAISKAKGLLSELIRKVEVGEKVVLTNHGRPVAEIKPIKNAGAPIEKLVALRKISKRLSKRKNTGPNAADSANFLYDDTGMPS